MTYPSNPAPSVQAEFWLTIALTAVPGMLGGITNGVSMFLKQVKAEPKDWPPNGNLSVPAFFLAQALSGVGGALAALLATLWANRFPEASQFFEAKALLTLLTTSYVAGYVANRLLPAIAESLYEQVSKLAERARKTSEQAEEAKKAGDEASERASSAEANANKAVELATEMVRASGYLAAKDFSQPIATLTLVAKLAELMHSFPTNRTLNILLARLYAEAARDHESAIAVLTAFVEAKKRIGEDGDVHTADACWNLANYYEEKFKTLRDASLRIKAIECLTESMKRMPSYYMDLMNDEDFAELRKSAESATLLAEAKLRYEEWLRKQKPENKSG